MGLGLESFFGQSDSRASFRGDDLGRRTALHAQKGPVLGVLLSCCRPEILEQSPRIVILQLVLQSMNLLEMRGEMRCWNLPPAPSACFWRRECAKPVSPLGWSLLSAGRIRSKFLEAPGAGSE